MVVAKTLVDAFAFRLDAVAIVGLFNFNKSQRHAVDQDGDIGAEFVATTDIR